jgi:hypothetical protein
MAVNEHYLKPMLNAGSSRVFNCNDRALKLIADGTADPYFFRMPRIHGVVLIKEALLQGSRSEKGGRVVGTKVYFPYNHADVYEGGRSVFYHEARLLEILNELLGLSGKTLGDADLQYDMKILSILDGLPSLDPFLMRDALEIEGIVANENYFDVSGAELSAIHRFIRRKFEPLVRAACEGVSEVSDKVTQLTDKIWEAKDREALEPLIRAFRFPSDEAMAIFASWKGIIFYIFEYYRAKERRERFGLWLRHGSTPRNFVSKIDLDHVAQLRRGTLQRLREQWSAVDAIAREYEALYARFLSDPNGIGDFLDFLRRSREIYWRMGDSLSKIGHAIHCWDATSASYDQRLMPYDKLVYLLDVLQTVLLGQERAESAVVWQ